MLLLKLWCLHSYSKGKRRLSVSLNIFFCGTSFTTYIPLKRRRVAFGCMMSKLLLDQKNPFRFVEGDHRKERSLRDLMLLMWVPLNVSRWLARSALPGRHLLSLPLLVVNRAVQKWQKIPAYCSIYNSLKNHFPNIMFCLVKGPKNRIQYTTIKSVSFLLSSLLRYEKCKAFLQSLARAQYTRLGKLEAFHFSGFSHPLHLYSEFPRCICRPGCLIKGYRKIRLKESLIHGNRNCFLSFH